MNSDRVALFLAPLFRSVTLDLLERQRSQYDVLDPPPGRVVFLGDSITREGAWDEWFPGLPILNRGASGDTVAGVTQRLDRSVNAPRAVSLLVGTNDLTGNGSSREVEDIAAQFRELVTRLAEKAPGAALLVNSVMPRTAWFAPRVRALNVCYRAAADEVGATFVDLWPALAQPDGAMRAELTRDHIHLNGAGYRAWVEVLGPELAPFGE